MFNQRIWRSIGVAIPIITTAVLWGIGIESTENLFSTGITPGHILGVALLMLAWGIWKNKI